jgi:hypothetical protein
MEIEMKVALPIRREGKYFVVSRADGLALLLGSSAVAGNHHLYFIEKRKKDWLVPVAVVKKRYEFVRDRIENDIKRLKIMHSILAQAGETRKGKGKW